MSLERAEPGIAKLNTDQLDSEYEIYRSSVENFLRAENDEEALQRFLRERFQIHKNKDLEFAMTYLDSVIDEMKEETGQKAQFKALSQEVKSLKDKVPEKDLTLLTEFTLRASYHAKHPEHGVNNARFAKVTGDVGQRSWGRVAAGIVLGIVGLALLATAVTFAISTAGVGTPLSGVVGWLGKAMMGWGIGFLAAKSTATIVAGVATTVVAAGSGVLAGLGARYLVKTSGSPYSPAAGAAHTLFNPKPVLKVVDDQKPDAEHKPTSPKAPR